MRVKRYSKLLQTWVSQATDDKLTALAEQTGLDKADVTRLILKEGLPKLLKQQLPIEQAERQ